MNTPVRRLAMPTGLYSVPKPVALRYLEKDENGHSRIGARTSPREREEDQQTVVQDRLSGAQNQG